MNKSLLVEQIIAHLNEKITDAVNAAQAAHLAAIDDQSVAETQYDTLAIESAYLAEGQTRRIAQYKADIELMSNPRLLQQSFNRIGIDIGSLVSLEQENGDLKYVYLAPAGAGLELKVGSELVTVITPSAPIGVAMLGLTEGEEFNLTINQNTQTYYILTIR